MAGIYFHIPFCKKKCIYCDFYSVTSIGKIEKAVDAFLKELYLRREELGGTTTISTLYFGGGTPSLLQPSQLELILNSVHNLFKVDTNAEITLEANPDDLNLEYLNQIKSLGINRLSIGTQSFSDRVLLFMNRRHNAKQAIDSVYNARKAGFNNISIDLIYGIPQVSSEEWNSVLDQALDLDVEHISAYHLTYHEQTALWNKLKKGEITEVDEEVSLREYELLVKKTSARNYLHYEISNFAKEGFYSRHNSSYWKQIPYLGIGPAAHSYNGISRRWNLSNLDNYISGAENGSIPYEMENLSENDRFNEYLITTTRTIWGCDLNYIEQNFGVEFVDRLKHYSQKYIESQHLYIENNKLYFSELGLFVSDMILSELIV